MKIAYIGHIFFCKKIGRKLEERGHEVKYFNYNHWGRKLIPSMKDIWDVDVIHFICAVGCRKYFYLIIIRYLLKKKIFVHFVGSDILRLKKVKVIDRINWIFALKTAHRIFTGAPWHVKELENLISTESFILFFANYEKIEKILPLPEKFTVLCYLPQERSRYYGEELIKILIEEYPNIKFIILGSEQFIHYNNVLTKKIDYNIDMTELYSQSTLLVRLPKHDGFSSMVLEALSFGRNIIWTHNIPHVQHTELYRDDLIQAFESAKKKDSNSKGAIWVKEKFNYNVFINNLESLYNNPNTIIDSENYQ